MQEGVEMLLTGEGIVQKERRQIMAENTKISWADHTFNHIRGCVKIAEGCKNCYAATMSKRNTKTLGLWGPEGVGRRVVAAESYWKQPRKWDREAAKSGVRKRVFCASLADVFEDWSGPMHDTSNVQLFRCPCGATRYLVGYCKSCGKMPHSGQLAMGDVRRRLFELIDATPNLDWLILTKRPENIRKFWPAVECNTCGGYGKVPGWSGSLASNSLEQTAEDCPECSVIDMEHRENVWLLTSVAVQADADRNVPELLKCRDLVPVLGISAEPLCGPVNLRKWMPHLDWVIGGGESGHDPRPCNIKWLRSLQQKCGVAGVPFYMKQFGAKPVADEQWPMTSGADWNSQAGEDRQAVRQIRHSKGADPSEWPEDMRVQQFPEVARE